MNQIGALCVEAYRLDDGDVPNSVAGLRQWT